MSRSTRWCPTPEQLMILEELYRGGLRTPKAFQIQKITAHLSLYGKIEGKNVFYWFQNHKARDRQKLRRKLMSKQYLGHQQLLQEQLYQQHQHHNLENPLHHLESYSSSALHQLPCYISAGCLHQGRVEDASPIVRDYIWKVDVPRTCQMDNHMNRTYGHDWKMMMMDVGHAIPSCTTNRPLETLSLFPTTATSLKDQSTAN